jgi:hypothetical protein
MGLVPVAGMVPLIQTGLRFNVTGVLSDNAYPINQLQQAIVFYQFRLADGYNLGDRPNQRRVTLRLAVFS